MEYYPQSKGLLKPSRDELKDGYPYPDNFLEKYGKGSYPNAKVVLAVGCNTLVYAPARKYFSQLFPNAVVLGHINKNPANATGMIRHFLRKYFRRVRRDDEGKHLIASWLSYYFNVNQTIMGRGYGLAASHKEFVFGIDVDNSYSLTVPLAESGDWINRRKYMSKKKRGKKVDELVVFNKRREKVTDRYRYQGERVIHGY